jgi:ABC-2 type transport system permease protein
VTRYWRLASIFTSASIAVQLEYRANFVINVITSVLAAAGGLFGLLLVYGDGQAVGGWSTLEATVVLGVFTFGRGFISAVLAPNLNRIAEGVRTGTMDFVLLKPVDAQFYVSTRNLNILKVPDLLVGLGLAGWALLRLPAVSLGGVLAGALLLLASLAIVYSIWFALATTAFWFVRVENVTELFNGFYRAGQFPVSVYPPVVRLVFSTIVPIAFVTTVPASAVLGRLEPLTGAAALGLAAALTLGSRWFWRRAVRSYTSASS